MSLRLQPSIPPVPDDTARVARTAFRRGNPCLLLRDLSMDFKKLVFCMEARYFRHHVEEIPGGRHPTIH